jgi:DNA repair protein RecO (recombination protein O)
MKIKEVKNTMISKDIHSSINKTTLTIAISEMMYKTIREEEQNENLYDYCLNAIKILNNSDERLNNFFLVFSTQYLRHVGFYPVMNYDVDHPVFNLLSGKFSQKAVDHEMYMSLDESKHFNLILNLDLKDFNSIEIPVNLRQEIMKHLLSYYEIHVNGFNKLNSYAVLLSVFH